jgi:hypothetical protein
MEPSTPASGGKVALGDVTSLTDAKARALAQAWISAMNRIPHFTPEPPEELDDFERVLLSRPSGGDIMASLFSFFHPIVRRRAMFREARALGVERRTCKELLRRFDEALPRTRSLTYDEQVTAIAAALRG